jgi:hypothetical protein
MKVCPQKLRWRDVQLDAVRSVVPAGGFLATFVPMVAARRSARPDPAGDDGGGLLADFRFRRAQSVSGFRPAELRAGPGRRGGTPQRRMARYGPPRGRECYCAGMDWRDMSVMLVLAVMLAMMAFGYWAAAFLAAH